MVVAPSLFYLDGRSMEFRSDMQVELVQSIGSDASIVAAAKVSTQGVGTLESYGKDESAGLINFLMKNRHGTPFEHASMTFFIRAPIFVFREFHRHRIGWSYNEESGRYKQLEPVFYIPNEGRNLVQRGRPGHYEYVAGSYDQWRALTNDMVDESEFLYTRYDRKLKAGIAKEVARMTLPVNIYSSMYATCNPRSLMAFLSLRTKWTTSTFPSFPMREIEMVAEHMEQSFLDLFPLTRNAFHGHGRVSP